MPQASDELRQWAEAKFGSIDESGPEEFLKSKGWSENNWRMTSPMDLRWVSEDEWKAIQFLIFEWDYAFRDRQTVEPY